MRWAMAMPTGPASEPMITSGSAAVPGGPLATKASPLRNRMPSAIVLPPLRMTIGVHDGALAFQESIMDFYEKFRLRPRIFILGRGVGACARGNGRRISSQVLPRIRSQMQNSLKVA